MNRLQNKCECVVMTDGAVGGEYELADPKCTVCGGTGIVNRSNRPDLKIHVAGPLVGRVQRCVRCHTRIDSNRIWPDSWPPSAWQPGVRIAADRYGKSAIDETNAGKYADVRACGRAA